MGHPFDTAQVKPCTECGSTKGYSKSGKFRVHCLNCQALVTYDEVGMTPDPDPTTDKEST